MNRVIVRAPDLHKDGWCLLDGEQLNRDAPKTFHIPDLAVRRNLQLGDFAKLVFEIAVEGDKYPSVERMWVVIRERTPSGYLGVLDNEPDCISENDSFWLGTEVPFDHRHIIAVQGSDEASVALAKAPVPIPWNPSN
jgi:hypothetical protein